MAAISFVSQSGNPSSILSPRTEERKVIYRLKYQKKLGRKLNTPLILLPGAGQASAMWSASTEPFPRVFSGTSWHLQPFPSQSIPALLLSFWRKRNKGKKVEWLSAHKEKLLVLYSFIYSHCLRISHTNTVWFRNHHSITVSARKRNIFFPKKRKMLHPKVLWHIGKSYLMGQHESVVEKKSDFCNSYGFLVQSQRPC